MALASSGITTAAVGNILGTTSRDVGALCTNSNINIWSVWKPIAHTATTLTYDILKNANFGISIKSATTTSSLLTAVQNNGNKGFTYNKPTNNYRLGDFRNYDNTASTPLEATFKDGDVVKIGNVATSYTQGIEGIEQAAPDDLTKSTFLTKYHIYPSDVMNKGVLITDGTNTRWSVGNIPWGNTYWQQFKGKSLTALEFMTNLPSGRTSVTHTAAGTDKFYALPYPLHTISASTAAPAGSRTVFVSGDFTWTNTSFTAVSYNFRFSSIGEQYGGGTLSNIWIKLCKDRQGVNAIASTQLVSGSITVGTEETSQLFRGFLTSAQAAMNNYICIWWNNTLQYTTQAMAEVMPEQ